MIVINLLNELNSKSILDAVEIMNALTEEVSVVSPHLDIWDIYVIRGDKSELARIELTIHGTFVVENFIHSNMEINSFYIPPFRRWADDVVAMITMEFRARFNPN